MIGDGWLYLPSEAHVSYSPTKGNERKKGATVVHSQSEVNKDDPLVPEESRMITPRTNFDNTPSNPTETKLTMIEEEHPLDSGIGICTPEDDLHSTYWTQKDGPMKPHVMMSHTPEHIQTAQHTFGGHIAQMRATFIQVYCTSFMLYTDSCTCCIP